MMSAKQKCLNCLEYIKNDIESKQNHNWYLFVKTKYDKYYCDVNNSIDPEYFSYINEYSIDKLNKAIKNNKSCSENLFFVYNIGMLIKYNDIFDKQTINNIIDEIYSVIYVLQRKKPDYKYSNIWGI